MKKSIALLLVMVLGVTLFTGCGDSGSSGGTPVPKEAGYYVIDSVLYDGEEYSPEDLEGSGVEESYAVFNTDGSGVFSTSYYIKGTWENGEFTYEEDGEEYTNSYTLDGDLLKFDVEDEDEIFTLVLERTAAAFDNEALKGTWEGTDSNGTDVSFTFDANRGVKFKGFLDEKGSYTILGDMLEVILNGDVRTYHASIRGNKLILDAPDYAWHVSYELAKK